MQGGLTAEQLAHIVATVTAKVVEELGGQPGNVTWDAVQDKPDAFPAEPHRHNASDIDDLPSGGGGAGIDDTTIGTDTTWSSQQITTDRAPAMWPVIPPGAEGPVAEIPVNDGLNMLYQVAATSIVWNQDPPEHGGLPARPEPGITIAAELPQNPYPNYIYAIRGSDGTITWHWPVVEA